MQDCLQDRRVAKSDALMALRTDDQVGSKILLYDEAVEKDVVDVPIKSLPFQVTDFVS